MPINAIRADLVYTGFFKHEFKEVAAASDAHQRLVLVACPNHPSVRYSVILDAREDVEHQERQVSDTLLRYCPKHPPRIGDAESKPAS